MVKKVLKWLDRSFFPMITPQEYAYEALETALRELLKAQDQLDYAQSVVEYRRAQVERLITQTNNTNYNVRLLAGLTHSASGSNAVVAVRQD